MTKRSLPNQGRPPVKRQAPNTPKSVELEAQQQQEQHHLQQMQQQQQQQQYQQQQHLQHQQHQHHQQYIKQEQPSKAQTEYELATGEVWAAIARCASLLQLHTLSVHSFESSLRHTPDNAESLVGFSKSLKVLDSNVGLKQSADVLLSSLQRFPVLSKEYSIWKELAETHLSSNETQKAYDAISRALSYQPENPELQLISADCLLKLGMPEPATARLHSIIQSFAYKTQLTEPEVEILRKSHSKLAQIALLENRTELASSEMKSALSLPPPPPSKINEQATLWAFFVTIRERAGDLEDAIKIIHEAISILGHLPKLLTIQAYLFLIPNTTLFDPKRAIILLKSAINNHRLSGKPEAEEDFLEWYLLGNAHSAVAEPREAYDAFQFALRIGPSSPLPWLAVGSLYLRMGQLPDALAAYSQAARLLVDDNSVPSAAASAAAWDGLSCVYERCDDQAHDAADACLRASACFRAAGDLRSASQFEQRAHNLTAATRHQAPLPALKGPPEPPLALLRELIVFGSSKELFTQAPPPEQLRFQSQNSPEVKSEVSRPSQGSISVPSQKQLQNGSAPHLRTSPSTLPLQRSQSRQQIMQPEPYQQQPTQQPQIQIQVPSQSQPPPSSQAPTQAPPQSQSQSQSQTQSQTQHRGHSDIQKQFHHLPLPRGSLASRSNTPDVATKINETPETGHQVAQWSPPQTQIVQHAQPLPLHQTNEADLRAKPNGSTFYVNQPVSRSILVTNGTPSQGTPLPQTPQSTSELHSAPRIAINAVNGGQPNTVQLVQGPILVQAAQSYPPNGAPQGYGLPPPGFSFTNGPQPAVATPYVPWR